MIPAMLPRIALACVWLLAASPAFAQRLSPLAATPDWAQLEKFQETITRDDFIHLLNQVYAPAGAAKGMVEVETEAAVIKTTLTPPTDFRLRFAKDTASAKPTPRFWRPAAQLPPAPPEQPLLGIKIAIDAGHIGGPWAKMEERWLQLSGDIESIETPA